MCSISHGPTQPLWFDLVHGNFTSYPQTRLVSLSSLGLALALSIPETFLWRHSIIVVTFAVVAFSIIVQGLTCRPLLRSACDAEE
jgi:hypothetical protein